MCDFDEREEGPELGDMLIKLCEENQTRKILAILNECKDLEEAKKMVRALIEK